MPNFMKAAMRGMAKARAGGATKASQPVDRTKRASNFGRSAKAQVEGGKTAGAGARRLLGGAKSGGGAKTVRPSGGMLRSLFGMRR